MQGAGNPNPALDLRAANTVPAEPSQPHPPNSLSIFTHKLPQELKLKGAAVTSPLLYFGEMLSAFCQQVWDDMLT